MPLREFKSKLVPEIKELNVFLKKNLLSSSMSGEIISSLKGRGIEFEDYRDYSVTDDAARIDWRASKRSQRLLVREYKLDVNFNVFFLIDTSESMLYSSIPKLKCEYAAEVAASIYYGVLQSGNSVGFALFNNGILKMSAPNLGKKQFYIFTKEISNPKNYGGQKELGKAIQQTLSVLDKRALIFILSDFICYDETWVQFLKILSERHELIGIMIRDQRDFSLPKETGQLILEDPFSGEKIYIDAKQYHHLYEEFNQKQLKVLRSIFEHNRSSLLELTTNTPYLNPVLQFFRRRGGRWK